MTYIVQLFTGAAGSVAFGILFHMKKKHLPLAALGGFLGWLLFIICRECWGGVFFPTLAAAFGIDLYAETLYYCMRSVVEGDLHQAWNYGRDTFLYALGIAAGMSIAWAICDFLRKIKGKQEIS